MATGTNLTAGIDSALYELYYHVDRELSRLNNCSNFESAYVNILLAKPSLTVLFELCAQVDSEARPRIEERAQKIKGKIIHGEQVGKFRLEKPQIPDPRVERLMGKIMKKRIPSEEVGIRTSRYKHCQWRIKLDQIASEEPNALTAKMIKKAKRISQAKCLKKEEQASMVPTSFEFNRTDIPKEPVPREKIGSVISSLQKIVESFSPQAKMDFFEALEYAAESMGVDIDAVTESELDSIIGRICFQLNQIHEKENPEKIDRTDPHWALQAILPEERRTSEQNRRAAQRFQVEILVSLLFLSIRREDNEQSRQLLDAFEQIRLDPKDLPEGKTNAAHLFFEKLYGLYVEARKQDLSLQDPDDEKFNGDFGRQAFRGIVEVPILIKQKAFVEVMQSICKTWELPSENQAVVVSS